MDSRRVFYLASGCRLQQKHQGIPETYAARNTIKFVNETIDSLRMKSLSNIPLRKTIYRYLIILEQTKQTEKVLKQC